MLSINSATAKQSPVKRKTLLDTRQPLTEMTVVPTLRLPLRLAATRSVSAQREKVIYISPRGIFLRSAGFHRCCLPCGGFSCAL